jgi:hypothetical protein
MKLWKIWRTMKQKCYFRFSTETGLKDGILSTDIGHTRPWETESKFDRSPWDTSADRNTSLKFRIHKYMGPCSLTGCKKPKGPHFNHQIGNGFAAKAEARVNASHFYSAPAQPNTHIDQTLNSSKGSPAVKQMDRGHP